MSFSSIVGKNYDLSYMMLAKSNCNCLILGLFLFSLLRPLSINAQSADIFPVLTFSKDSVLPGDTVLLILRLKTSTPHINSLLLDSDNLLTLHKRNAIDVISTGKWDFNATISGKLYQKDHSLSWDTLSSGTDVTLQNNFLFIPYRTGTFKPPGFRVVFNNNADTLFFPGHSFTSHFVVYSPNIPDVYMEVADSIKLATIHDIIKEPARISDKLLFFLLYLFIGGVSATILFLLLKTIPDEQTKIIKDYEPHLMALASLAAVEKSGFTPDFPVKDWYSKLSFIFKTYLENAFSIRAIESTSSEIIAALKTTNLQESIIHSILQFIKDADSVKFAKSNPGLIQNQESFNRVINFIIATAPLALKGNNQQPITYDHFKQNKLHDVHQVVLIPTPIWRRLLAGILDLLPALLTLLIFWGPFSSNPLFSQAFEQINSNFLNKETIQLFIFLTLLLWQSYLLSKKNRTSGLSLFSSTLIRQRNKDITFLFALIYTLSKWSTTLLFSVFNLIPAFVNKDQTTLLDLLTKTRVVYRQKVYFQPEAIES